MGSLKWKGYFEMKKLTAVTFTYQDGTIDTIDDARACLLFQSRCNTSGVLSGFEDFMKSNEATSNDEPVK